MESERHPLSSFECTMSESFPCHRCDHAVSVAEFIDSCTVAWLPQQWLLSRCSRCNEQAHVEIKSDVVRFGRLEGAPAPCFISEKSQRIPGLSFSVESDGIRLHFGDHQKLVNT